MCVCGGARSHRQAVIAIFDVAVEEELREIEELIAADRENNSAWNYRYFLVHRCGKPDRAAECA